MIGWVLGLAGCGYRTDFCCDQEGNPKEICIPYVVGDLDGALTAEIVRTLSPYYICRSEGGCYMLKITINDDYDENIGFRYDRKRNGRIKHYIIPVESRRSLVADVELVDRATLKTVQGPVTLSATVEFDHEYETVRDNANTFSLGQLTDYDAAYETSSTPLYTLFAQRVLWFLLYVDGNISS